MPNDVIVLSSDDDITPSSRGSSQQPPPPPPPPPHSQPATGRASRKPKTQQQPPPAPDAVPPAPPTASAPLPLSLGASKPKRVTKRSRGDTLITEAAPAKRAKRNVLGGGASTTAVVGKPFAPPDAAGLFTKYRPQAVAELVTSTSRNETVKKWLQEARRAAGGGATRVLFMHGPCGSGKRTLVHTLAGLEGFRVREWREVDSWGGQGRYVAGDASHLQSFSDAPSFSAAVVDADAVAVRKESPLETFRKALMNRRARGVVGAEAMATAQTTPELVLITALPACHTPTQRRMRDEVLADFVASLGMPPGGGSHRTQTPCVVFTCTTYNSHSVKYQLHQEYPDAFLACRAVQHLEVHPVTQAQLKKRLTAIASKEAPTKQQAGVVVEAVMQRTQGDIRQGVHELAFNLLRPLPRRGGGGGDTRVAGGGVLTSEALTAHASERSGDHGGVDAGEEAPATSSSSASAPLKIGSVTLEGRVRSAKAHDLEDIGGFGGGGADFVANGSHLDIGHATSRVLGAKRVDGDPAKPLQHALLETLQRVPVGPERFLDYLHYSAVRYAQTRGQVEAMQQQQQGLKQQAAVLSNSKTGTASGGGGGAGAASKTTAFAVLSQSMSLGDGAARGRSQSQSPSKGAGEESAASASASASASPQTAPPLTLPHPHHALLNAPADVGCIDRLARTARRYSDANVYGRTLSPDHRSTGWASQCYFLWSVQLHAEHRVPPARATSFEQCHPPPQVDGERAAALASGVLRPAFKDDVWMFYTNRRALTADLAPMLPLLLLRNPALAVVQGRKGGHAGPTALPGYSCGSASGNRPMPFTQPQPLNRPVPFHPGGAWAPPPQPPVNRPVPFNPSMSQQLLTQHHPTNKPMPFVPGMAPVPMQTQPPPNRPVPFNPAGPGAYAPPHAQSHHLRPNRPVPFVPGAAPLRPVPFVGGQAAARPVPFDGSQPSPGAGGGGVGGGPGVTNGPPPPPAVQLTALQLKHLKELTTFSKGQWDRVLVRPAKAGPRLPLATRWERPRVGEFQPHDLLDSRVLVGQHEQEEPVLEAVEDPNDPIADFD